ncbi:MAG TPA: PEP-CTERM sorting domain-containing protein [Bryobacteraceae bacterium]|nr:PEP-CTERM sorting domain-containing protein [Bryobacteraceae bacterium]HPT25585.1 PEP-CTERM sorting domain-containing protein [Bryobacteraceae bacterium]
MKVNQFVRCVVSAFALAALAPAAVIIDKTPDLGASWSPLSSSGTYVYSNSFVFTGASGTLADTLGAYMLVSGSGTGAPFRFELLGDDSNSPNPGSVLAVTGYQTSDASTLQLITGSLLVPYALTNGTRYWVAASTVGQSGGNSYQVGGHTQNSIYPDDGTFWYSNDSAGTSFDGQVLTPEMAIYVAGGESAVPEPASMATVTAGLGLLAFLRRRRS